MNNLKNQIDKFILENKDKIANKDLLVKAYGFIMSLASYKLDGIDHWEMPSFTINLGKGDCEDWAAVIFDVLRKLNFKNIRMALFEKDKDCHMSVIWFDENNICWILDSTRVMTDHIIKLKELIRWKLKASFDENNQWKHNN